MWQLPGETYYAAGASGTVTIPAGMQLLQVHAHATSAGTVVIFGGASIPIPAGAGWGWQIQHLNWVSGSARFSNALTLVFTGTDAYFVEYRMGGAI
jgi:hypothetical protein